MKRIVPIAVLVLALGSVAAGVGIAGVVGDDDRPVTGAALGRAAAAALEHTGGGRVTATEAGDEDGAYEVEVTLADGSQVDVHLDAGFRVLGTEADEADAQEGDAD